MGDATEGGESANYRLRDEEMNELVRSLPRDQVFEVQQRKVTASMRQELLYHDEEWRGAVEEVTLTKPGPMPPTEVGSSIELGDQGESIGGVVGRGAD